MNHFTVSPEHVDELVSAALDGELHSAALELGLDPVAVETWLVSDPVAVARTRSFQSARSAVRSDATVLDELSRRRLVRTALDASPATPATTRRRRTGGFVAAGAAAAVAIGVVVAANGPSSSPSMVAKNAVERSSTAQIATPALADFGAIDDPNALVTSLRTQSEGVTSDVGAQSVAPGAGRAVPGDALPDPHTSEATGDPTTQSGTATAPPGTATPNSASQQRPAPSSRELDTATGCLASLPGSEGGRLPVLVARLVYRGTPALVATTPGTNHTTAWVFVADSCRLLLTAQVG